MIDIKKFKKCRAGLGKGRKNKSTHLYLGMKALLPVDDDEILDGKEGEEGNLKVLFACRAHSVGSNVKPV